MKVPAEIDRILDLGEACFRKYFRTADPAPATETAALEAHLRSLSFGYLYLTIVAVEIGRGVLHVSSWFQAYLAASGAFPKHYEAVERLMKDPTHLARFLEGGIFDMYRAGIDVNRLFEVPKPENPQNGGAAA